MKKYPTIGGKIMRNESSSTSEKTDSGLGTLAILMRPRWRAILIVTLVLSMSIILPVAILNRPPTVRGLPSGSRTIGFLVDSNGFEDVSGSKNPVVTIYDGTNTAAFLKSNDGKVHRLVIFTPTVIQSPGFTGLIKFDFRIDTAGSYAYCDFYTGKCGVLKVPVRGDVNGDFRVFKPDNDTIAQYFGSSLSSTWNSADKPYLDGRVDATDLNVVAFYFGVPPPWPAPYNPDVNGDGTVNIVDLSTVGAQYGATAPAPFNNPNQGPDINYDNIVNIIDAATMGANWNCDIFTCP